MTTTYYLYSVPQSERAKCELDRTGTYIPEEHLVGVHKCEDWEIDRWMANEIKNGRLPRDTQYSMVSKFAEYLSNRVTLNVTGA